MGWPSFPHFLLTSNFRFYAYSWHSKVGFVIPHPVNHMHKVFPHQMTFCIRLMFYHVRLGKEWAGPAFPHPMKSKGYMHIHDRVRLAVFIRRQLTICTTVFPHPITFWTRLMGEGGQTVTPETIILHSDFVCTQPVTLTTQHVYNTLEIVWEKIWM